MAHAAEADAGDAPAKKGKKKLVIIVAAALLVVLLGGGAAVFFMKKKAAAAASAEEEGDGGQGASLAAMEERRKEISKHPPVFVPLEPFVVNLSDKEADRFAQVGITLEVDDAKFAEELKLFMPAIRNGILMVLSHKSSQQLLAREGKLLLAQEIMREAVLPLGIQVSASEPEAAAAAEPADADAEEEDPDEPKAKGKGKAKGKKPKKAAGMHNPIKNVHFSTFIVQ